MFDCVLNKTLALDVNDACFGDEPISPMRMRNKKKHNANEWYRCGKCDPGVPISKPLSGSKIDSTFHTPKLIK